MKNNVLTILLSIFYMAGAAAQSIELDKSFNGSGYVTFPVNQSKCFSLSVLAQPDGKILVGGDEGNAAKYMVIARLNADGSLDNSFGDNGKVSAKSNVLLAAGGNMKTMVLQGEKLLVGGYFIKYPTPWYNYGVMRLTKNGQIDSTFGAEGKLEIVYDYASDPIDIEAMAVRPDGKILIVGNSTTNVKVLQYDRNGKRDPTFTVGKIPIEPNTSTDCSIALSADGKLLVAIGTGTGLLMSRFLPNGQIDKTFGTNGSTQKVLTYLASSFINLARLLLNPVTGVITVGLTGIGHSPAGFFWVRYNKDGILTQSFGNNGAINYLNRFISAAILQPDGKMLTQGRTTMIRYNRDGSVDNAFGSNSNGQVYVLFGDTLANNNSRVAYAMAEYSNGYIVVAGTINNELAVARYRIGLSTGVSPDAAAFQENVRLSPNPIQENGLLEYRLNAPDRLTIQLRDLQGRLIQTFMNDAKQETGTHQLPIEWPEQLLPGVYYLSVTSPDKRACIKVVKN